MVNDVDNIQVQEGRSVRQQEVRAIIDDSDDSTISKQFVGTKMDQNENFRINNNDTLSYFLHSGLLK